MFPLSRLVISSFAALRKPSLQADGIDETFFYCRPWDLDLFGELNNGRVLSLFDIGRFSLATRMGLTRTLFRNRWGLAVAGSSIRYRKRVHLFNKVTMRTQVIGMDDKWFYIMQSMWVKGEAASSVVMRTCVTEKGRIVPTRRVREALGETEWQPVLPAWVRAVFIADDQRPWPPEI